MRQTELQLTDEERQLIESFRAKGMHHAREVNRAHILAALDREIPESQIMDVLGVGRTLIWRTRAAYLREDWNMLCATRRDQESLDSTIRTWKHRLRHWLVPLRRKAPNAGRWVYWNKRHKRRPVSARSAGRPSAGC